VPEPSRREKILIGLRLAFALTEQEAEHMLGMYNVELARETREEILALPEPKVWAAPLKWWRRGRDAALGRVCSEVFDTTMTDKIYNEKGHRIT
jgi:hypothetical protein